VSAANVEDAARPAVGRERFVRRCREDFPLKRWMTPGPAAGLCCVRGGVELRR
jgi:hypothetical protein